MVSPAMRLLLLPCALVCLLSSTVLAQGNDLYGPAGGRSALMGNTGVALGRDGSGPFYNPATIVRIFDEKLAFSANFYSIAVTNFEDWHAPNDLDESQFGRRKLANTGLTVASFRSLPSSLCLFLTLEDLARLAELGKEDPSKPHRQEDPGTRRKLALCFASIESEDVDLQAIRFEGQTEGGPTTQVQSLQRRWNRIYAGPTYSLMVHEDLAFGASLQAVYSYTSFGVAGSSVSTRLGGDGVAGSLSTSGRGNSFDLTGIVGATYRYRRLMLGASVRAPAFHLFGSYEGTSSHGSTAMDADDALVATATGSFRAPPPIRIALGAGLSFERLRLELDGALNLPVQNLMRARLDVSSSRLRDGDVARERTREAFVVPSHVVLHPSAGAEYFLSSDFSLMAGVSANFSSLSELRPRDSVGNLVQARTHHLTGSLGIGSYWDGGELLFGLQLDYGWGEAIALNPYATPNLWSVIDATSFNVTFVVSGSASLRAIVRVVDEIAGPGD